MTELRATILFSLAVALLAACDRPDVDRDGGAVSSSPARPQPGLVIDSSIPPDEALRRFRAGLERPAHLDGPHSRDELVRRFIRAFERKDAAGIRALSITRAEFAYLVFPDSRLAKPPYRQPPEIAWLLLQASTGSGINKLVNKAPDRFRLLDYRCELPPESEGSSRVYSGCQMRVREGGANRFVRLFGRVIERDGRWKFIGMDGDL